jgi:hypothetical protein
MALSNNKNDDMIAIFEGEEALAFNEYAHRDLNDEEKKELKEDLEFYTQHCPSIQKAETK